MLTVSMVQTLRRGDQLYVRKLNTQTRKRAVIIAGAYLDIAAAHHGQTRRAFEDACSSVSVHAREQKLAVGLKKLVTDRCRFEMNAQVDPVALRQSVFRMSAEARKAAVVVEDFDREDVLESAGQTFELDGAETEGALFSDLKDAHRLVTFEPMGPTELVAKYIKSQHQAVLLRATGVRLYVKTNIAACYRVLFRKLKFFGLLHVIHPQERGGYTIHIDGPLSMFTQSTKYGLQLAMLLPALDEFRLWKLDAEVRWGKEKQHLKFHLEGRNPTPEDEEDVDPGPFSDEVATLVERFNKLKSNWTVEPSSEILELPGMGLCIPDLAFCNTTTGEVIFFEVMGYWSRQAVWQRVELVEAGLPQSIIFAVSKRLRVSQEVLGDDLPGSLYIYKGVMNPRQILALLEKNSGICSSG